MPKYMFKNVHWNKKKMRILTIFKNCNDFSKNHAIKI